MRYEFGIILVCEKKLVGGKVGKLYPKSTANWYKKNCSFNKLQSFFITNQAI